MLRRVAGPFTTLVLCQALAGAGFCAGEGSGISASSVYDARYEAQYAVDGKLDTRWASKASAHNPQWLQVDFDRVVPVNSMAIRWERAYAVEYQIQVSDNGRDWRTLRHVKEGKGGRELLEGLAGAARYLRIHCIKPGPHPLFSIWEIESPDGTLAQALADVGRKAAEAGERAAREARKLLAESLRTQGGSDIVFAVRAPGVDGHWYANFGYYAADVNRKCYRAAGGRLCRLDASTGEVQVIFDDPQGSVRDPQVHYDGVKILFSYLKGGTANYHLYEINADGTGLRQLTDGDCDDIEPTYLPDGGIMFCSSRCNRWVNCWLTPVAVLYRCDADGGNVRMVSANVEHDNTPWVLPDGRVLYMRWEYVDRSQVDYHHLWTMNPDGTGQMVYFGNMHPGIAMLDAKPIPNTRKTVAIFSPGHGQREHMGRVTIVDPASGPDRQASAQTISVAADLRDPYPLDENRFLVAKGAELQLMDAEGRSVTIYRLPEESVRAGMWCHEPRPLVPRPRERVIPSRVNLSEASGRLVLTDVYKGRNMEGVKRGDIRKLLVLETLPKPINYTGGMDPLSYGGTFTLERVLGTVPVEPDGSAYMELPALRGLLFVALDENDMSVKRMQSFLTVQPGELTGCVGCHEQRTHTAPASLRPLAVRRPPSPITPIRGVPEVFDFPRDIQPILDRHCVRCHDYQRQPGARGPECGPRAGGVILTGDRGPMFSHSYYTLTYLGEFADGRDRARSNLPPRTIGAVASPMMKKLTGEHYSVALSSHEIDMIRYWIEVGAPYPGTYAALGSGMIGGYYQNQQVETDRDWPSTRAAGEAIQRRCASCHDGPKVLPRSLSDERGVSFWRPDWSDPRLRLSRHLVFNLTRPEQSLMLLAPLSAKAGGYGTCQQEEKNGDGVAVFASTDDRDYGSILAMCAAGKERLDQIKRFDMPGFRPPDPYLREMVRYGVLDAFPGVNELVNPYAVDQAYWRSQWYRPEGSDRPPQEGIARAAG
ncbi:MAG: discoidin domain-containing protein [Armatimonadota bacterium]